MSADRSPDATILVQGYAACLRHLATRALGRYPEINYLIPTDFSMRAGSFAVLIAALLSGCSGAETIVRSLQTYRRVCPNGVVFFASAAAVPSRYREVALFPIQPVIGREQAKLASAIHRQHAGDLGANGIILTSALSAANGNKVIGPAIGDPAKRRGMGVAIYIPSDSTRVSEACRLPLATDTTTGIPVADALMSESEDIIISMNPPVAERRAARPIELRKASLLRPFDLSGRETRAVGPTPEEEVEAQFFRNQDVRSALATLERLRVVNGAEEVRPGLVRLSIRELAPRATLEYHISFLHASYQATLPFGQDAIVELWSQGIKLGEFTNHGLIIGADYARPESR